MSPLCIDSDIVSETSCDLKSNCENESDSIGHESYTTINTANSSQISLGHNNSFSVDIQKSNEDFLNIHQYKNSNQNVQNNSSFDSKRGKNSILNVAKVPSSIRLKNKRNEQIVPDSELIMISSLQTNRNNNNTNTLQKKSKRNILTINSSNFIHDTSIDKNASNKIITENVIGCSNPLKESHATKCNLLLNSLKLQRYRLGVSPVKKILRIQSDLDEIVENRIRTIKRQPDDISCHSPLPNRSARDDSDYMTFPDLKAALELIDNNINNDGDVSYNGNNSSAVISVVMRHGDEEVCDQSVHSNNTERKLSNMSKTSDDSKGQHNISNNKKVTKNSASGRIPATASYGSLSTSSSLPQIKKPYVFNNPNVLNRKLINSNNIYNRQYFLNNKSPGATTIQSIQSGIDVNKIAEKYSVMKLDGTDDDMNSLFDGNDIVKASKSEIANNASNEQDHMMASDDDRSSSSLFYAATSEKRRSKQIENELKASRSTVLGINTIDNSYTVADPVTNVTSQSALHSPIKTIFHMDPNSNNGESTDYFDRIREKLLSKKDKDYSKDSAIINPMESMDAAIKVNFDRGKETDGAIDDSKNNVLPPMESRYSDGKFKLQFRFVDDTKNEDNNKDRESPKEENTILQQLTDKDDEDYVQIAMIESVPSRPTTAPNHVMTTHDKVKKEKKVSCVQCQTPAVLWCPECKRSYCVTHWNLLSHHSFVKPDEVWENRRPNSSMERSIPSSTGINVHLDGTGETVQDILEDKEKKKLPKKLRPRSPLKFPFTNLDGNKISKPSEIYVDLSNPKYFAPEGHGMPRTAIEKDKKSAKNKQLKPKALFSDTETHVDSTHAQPHVLKGFKSHQLHVTQGGTSNSPVTLTLTRGKSGIALMCGQSFALPNNAKYRSGISHNFETDWNASGCSKNSNTMQYGVYHGITVAVKNVETIPHEEVNYTSSISSCDDVTSSELTMMPTEIQDSKVQNGSTLDDD